MKIIFDKYMNQYNYDKIYTSINNNINNNIIKICLYNNEYKNYDIDRNDNKYIDIIDYKNN